MGKDSRLEQLEEIKNSARMDPMSILADARADEIDLDDEEFLDEENHFGFALTSDYEESNGENSLINEVGVEESAMTSSWDDYSNYVNPDTGYREVNTNLDSNAYPNLTPTESKQKTPIWFTVIASIAACFCILFFCIAAGKAIKNEHFMKHAQKTYGVVTISERKSETSQRSGYCNYVTFVVDDVVYENIEFEDSAYSRLNDTVEVYYNPENPTKVDDGYIYSYKTRAILIVIGAVLFLILSVIIRIGWTSHYLNLFRHLFRD